MPNRILKESICTSENIDQLTPFQESFFYRLMVNCDDYGRMDARPKILASKLYPLRSLNPGHVTEALKALRKADLIILYEVDGKMFLQMKTWDRHQQIRAKRSKFPAYDSICNQLLSDDSICPRNPIQSESNYNPNPNPNPNRNPTRAKREESDKEDDLLFDRFWDVYPRKESKPAAKKAFDKIKPDEELLSKMIKAIERWSKTAQWQENGGQFIPYPASWLNQRKWEDIPPEAKPAAKKVLPAQDFEQRDYSDVPDDMMRALAEEMRIARLNGELD